MREAIREQVKNGRWFLSWSGNNWPLFNTAYQYTPKFNEEWQRVTGLPNPNVEITFWRNRECSQFNTDASEEKMIELFRKKFDEDPEFLVRSGVEYRPRMNAEIAALREMHATVDPAKLSNDELRNLMLQMRTHFSYNAMIDRYDARMEIVFTPMLQEYLLKRLHELGKEDLITEYTNTLVTPHTKSVIFEERTELFDIVRWVQSNQELVEAIEAGGTLSDAMSKVPQLEEKITGYLSRWVWMPMLVDNPPATAESIWAEIARFVSADKPLKVESKRLGDDYDEKVIERSKEYIAELNPPQKILHLIEGLRAMAVLRCEDYVTMSESSYYMLPLYTEIARRLGISYHDLKEFLPEEVATFLHEGTIVTEVMVKNRAAFISVLVADGSWQFCEGDEAKELWDIVNGVSEVREETKELKGTIGNKGIVRGKARVVFDVPSIEQLQSGEILVVAWVGAAFVPHMRRASGIVSEFGGLTSHPVIVAREFNIPAVVGVKDAAKIIKTGDLLEVDANTGFVRLV